MNVRRRIVFAVLLAWAFPAFSNAAIAQSAIAAAVAKPVSLPDIAIGSAKAPITLTVDELSALRGLRAECVSDVAVEIYRYRQGAFRVS